MKTYRVWKILDNPSLRNVRINVRQLSAYLIGYLAVELILIIVLGFTSPVHAEVYPYAFSDYASFPRTRCQGGSSAFTVVAYVFVALPCVVGLFLAFKTRNVSGEYTENKPILAAFYTLALAALVVTPISSVFGDQDLVFHLLIASLAILVVSSVSVFAFMLPKLLYHRGVLKKVAAHGSGQHGSHTSDGHTSAHASEAGGRKASIQVGNLEGALEGAGDPALLEEIEELKSELTELREQNAELRYRMGSMKKLVSQKGEDATERDSP